MSSFLLMLLLSHCAALPFHNMDFLDFMMEDEAGSGVTDSISNTVPIFHHLAEEPTCPFRCQCHGTVTQCSDLGLEIVPAEISADTTWLDLQNNKITEIKENDFKNLKRLHLLILVNNLITTIHPKAFVPLGQLERLYLSKNLLKEMPVNIPKSLQELRIHENKITKIKKSSFQGMTEVIVMELGSNPLTSSGIDSGTFAELKKVSYIRIADTNLTEIPKGLPSSLSELHLDGNKISKVHADSLKGLVNLTKFGLSHNEISVVENDTLAMVPFLHELHLDDNFLTKVPPGLSDHKNIKVIYLHSNKITMVGTDDFCPLNYNAKKATYSAISLFNNPVHYWEVQPLTFRCVYDRSVIQFGNYRKK
ncbi:decorin-like [Scleropages formosus]|uniref:Decorin n=1 Tax=Scleropages formosus TaxID=113540 RepID=A0A8C9RMS8_SCLFO|nr:decorin-like [Scleropages formosus]